MALEVLSNLSSEKVNKYSIEREIHERLYSLGYGYEDRLSIFKLIPNEIDVGYDVISMICNKAIEGYINKVS